MSDVGRGRGTRWELAGKYRSPGENSFGEGAGMRLEDVLAQGAKRTEEKGDQGWSEPARDRLG